MTLWLTRKALARACRVGTTHMAKWTADSWAFHCRCAVMHCQLAVRHVWHKYTQGHAKVVTGAQSSIPFTIEHICMVICFHLVFSSLSQSHSLQYHFNVNTFRNFITHPEMRSTQVLQKHAGMWLYFDCNPKLGSKTCPEDSQAESMRTVPHGPAIPSSQNSQIANLV